ncbi:NADPH-dependent 1-acyl dihydroxyacetone phosphate reductase [Coemansia sp. RSA 922]|nr:NADPH-dependent 1-acyl dihydroxyacetone phosphate reductase [Coemansia sp. S16]KAJ2068128.1 NADPH-dependent 1-acyl dihydroxyacetone phosphate reductase [Coemansia sp. S2]KAJ2100772.1 NADPH-dependent 1-acyl dihydroxyacetone phosphate reductase [Coemansia sp. RSA 922]KAJ2334207.1 NADPH-dependent 1-acyl dihydroxyacetone phosphate reductase [Coemansia sp. RSA 2673]
MTGTIANNERVVLISGCSAGGIGHHLALELAAYGCRVFAGVRTLSKAQTLVDNPLIEAVELDVTDDASVDAAVAYVLAATGGRIDMLVNNAGIHCVGPTVEVPLAQVQQVFNTNFIGLARLCRAVAPVMMDRRQGTIVNLGSASGYVATPWVGFYASTKAAVHAYSDSLRMELAPFGVNVVVVAAGCVKSNIVDNYSGALLDDNTTRYTMACPAIEEKFGLSQVEGVTPTSQFVRVVVPKILRSSPPAYITYGTLSKSTWFMHYMPPVIRDFVLSRRYGTHQLAKDLKSSSAACSGGAGPVSDNNAGGAGCLVSCKAPSISCPFASPTTMWVALAAAALGTAYALFK